MRRPWAIFIASHDVSLDDVLGGLADLFVKLRPDQAGLGPVAPGLAQFLCSSGSATGEFQPPVQGASWSVKTTIWKPRSRLGLYLPNGFPLLCAGFWRPWRICTNRTRRTAP